MTRSEALPKAQRIANRADFVRAYELGTRTFGRFVVVFAASNSFGHPRIGVTVTKKLGKANVRNRLKRWVREVYRRNRDDVNFQKSALDFVVNVKSQAVETDFEQFSRDLVVTLRKAAARSRVSE